ncbi:MAG TPA: translation initiation factor IF-2 [Dehalococcoidia bacterium]|nr:translation initiation factor IF-2 [Dehalococcoidia bacterium]
MTSERATSQVIELPPNVTVRELSELLQISSIDVIKELMKRGIMASINQTVDYEVAAGLASELGHQAKPRTTEQAPRTTEVAEEDAGQLQPRPPVVTILGHVDHGKTSLLDAIRETNVTAQETGGITQHIGAYQVEVNGQKITFIDTPGHEAFTAMRARGAHVTDIAVLVVAADDGIMPQTVEAIAHAKAAGVPLIVAINKIDLPDANPDRVKQQLTEHSVVIEEYGGDVVAVPVSAKTKAGLQDLLENIGLVAEISELKANPDRLAMGTVIESELDSTRGPMATVLVHNGTLHIGDVVVVGDTSGKIKAMFDYTGQRVKEAGPSTPVKVMGLEAVPQAGDQLMAVKDERAAREVVEHRERELALDRAAGRARTLEAMSSEIAAGKVKDLNIIVKADVHGSIEAIRTALERLSTDQVKVSVIHASTGNVNESDTMLALASGAIIIAFRVKLDPGARRQVEAEGVDVRHYDIIYNLVDDMEKAVKGMLEPEIVETVEGHAEVRQVFKVRGGRIAGCSIRDGTIHRNSLARVIRDGEVIHTSRISSLRRFTEDVREVATGFECGIGVEGFEEFHEGDVIEAFVRQAQTAA